MIAFGGAAPLHAGHGSARSWGSTEALVPPGAGVGSAIGFLRAPFSFEAIRGRSSLHVRLSTSTSAMALASVLDDAEGRGDDGSCAPAMPMPPIRSDRQGLHAVCRAGLGDPRSSCCPGPDATAAGCAAFLARPLRARTTTKLFGRSVEGWWRPRSPSGPSTRRTRHPVARARCAAGAPAPSADAPTNRRCSAGPRRTITVRPGDHDRPERRGAAAIATMPTIRPASRRGSAAAASSSR